jgi:hypothetical protein
MQNKHIPALIAVTLVFSLASVVSAAELSIGVQSGDWIEYNVSSTGAPVQGHDVQWARMEIVNEENPTVTVSITSMFTDGSNDTTEHTLNLQTGHLIDDFIIPANLNVGDTFVDENLGNVTIAQIDVRDYAGAERTVVSATVGNNTYIWDQATGVSVEGTSITSEYTIHTEISVTNMWQPALSQNSSIESLLVVTVVLFIIVLIAITAIARYRQNLSAEKQLVATESLD